MQDLKQLFLLMIKKKITYFLLIFFLLSNCSFDDKTGIWSGSEDELKKISEIEKQQKEIIDVVKVFSSDNLLLKEITLNRSIVLSDPIKNSEWVMTGLNNKNFLTNIYLPKADNILLKKKVGKNKFSIAKNVTSVIIYKKNIILSDDVGTIYSLNEFGKINWKKNIYQKVYKKIYKSLTFNIYNNNIYIADNIGLIYVLDFDTGKLIWIKNHGVSFKSNIKIFKNKIYLINQDNRIICLTTENGSKIWDIRTIESFIKSQNPLSIAISDEGDIIAITSSGDLFRASGKSGVVKWSMNTSETMLANATDFFKSTDVVIDNERIFFSSGTTLFSFNTKDGHINWEKSVSSVSAPIIDKKNIFFVTENGFFIIMDKDKGEIISSTNIFKVLKKKRRDTKITGFLMGSGKIYAVTENGYLIISSAVSGKVEGFKKIGDKILTKPIINDGKLYILTENSKLIVFN